MKQNEKSLASELGPISQTQHKDGQAEILSHFSSEQQAVIVYRQKLLAPLAYFIGKDFQIPVELNTPGEGWHLDLAENKIRIDPYDLLEKPMEYLRFVICHEGGHRRVSRIEQIPLETWTQPGFAFMMNAIEDPRTNNFVAEAYPRFGEQMDSAYDEDLNLSEKATDAAQKKLGFTPRFMQAGFEYIRQWYKETRGDTSPLSTDLPDEVRAVVEHTLNSARDSWLRYPSKAEADASEELIKQYATVSYEINRDEVWPEFKTLVELDLADQSAQELLKDMHGNGAAGEGQHSHAHDLKNSLNEAQQQELETALQNGTPSAQTTQAGTGQQRITNLDSLSEGLKQKIKDYYDSLPDAVKKTLAERAKNALEVFEKTLTSELEGKLSDNPLKKAERENSAQMQQEDSPSAAEADDQAIAESPEMQRFREIINHVMQGDAHVYERYRRDVLLLIDALERDLREILVARSARKLLSGFKTGKRISIKKRMQEQAMGIPAIASRAWQKREYPTEKDYAITLLIDLSGSMAGQKIRETFRAVILVAEVLNRLSIKTEILGFNEKLYELKCFGEEMSSVVREKLGGVLNEVNSESAAYNDDGWAVSQASARLARQSAAGKFLLVFSDGTPYESSAHSGKDYELMSVIANIMQVTDQKLIGLGIGPETQHVERYYPNSIANIGVNELTKLLADFMREVIANYDSF